MSNNEHDPFESLMAQLDDIEVPRDKLDSIIDSSVDPIYGAILAQSFVNDTPSHAQEAVVLRAASGLLSKHMDRFSLSNIRLQTDLAYGLPDTRIAASKENPYVPKQYINEVYVRGVFIKFGKLATRDNDTGKEYTHIAVEIESPALLNKFGEVVEDVPAPQIMVVPAGHISDYDINPKNS